MILKGEGSSPATPAQISNNNSSKDNSGFINYQDPFAPVINTTDIFDNPYLIYGAGAALLGIVYFLSKKK